MNQDKRDMLESIAKKTGVDLGDFMQIETIDLIRDPLGNTWTTVCHHRNVINPDPALYSCLAKLDLEKAILEGVDWIKRSDDFAPYLNKSADEVFYQSAQEDGFDYLVAEQYFHCFEVSQILVNPDMILFFNLFREKNGNYSAVDECGNKETVVEIIDDSVRMRTKYLLEYISARQMLFVQFVDGRVSSPGHYPHNAEVVHRIDEQSETFHYEINFQSTASCDYLFSMIYARSIVKPKNIETACLLLTEEHDSSVYPDFIIKENPDGSFERFTCDPSMLNNYYGRNSEDPDYLTPIYFKPDVLDKYRKSPFFDVTERYLQCGTQWGVEIDNVNPHRVMVYLGDLGRDLPQSEREHFRQYELSPDGQAISLEALCNDFFNLPMEPTGPVSSLIEARSRLNVVWNKKFGTPLYRDLHSDEEDMPKLIRVPSGNGREEFESVIINLAKYCIEYIVESQFEEKKRDGSINKLDSFLSVRGISCNLKPFRDLQAIRSNSAVHSKGKNHDKLKGNLIGDEKPEDIEKLLGRLTETMKELTESLIAEKSI